MNIFRQVAILAILLISVQAAYAIGIGPARTTIDFQPGLEQSFEMLVVNNAGRDITATIYVQDTPLAPYVTLPQNRQLEIKKGESKRFAYSVRLPQSISTPGINDIIIGVVEGAQSDSAISTTTGATAKLEVRVPYPGKYLELRFRAGNTRAGEPAPVEVAYVNRGTETIEQVTAEAQVFKDDQYVTGTAIGSAGPIEPLQEGTLEASFPTEGLGTGLYQIAARVSYDGKLDALESKLRIGEEQLYIRNTTREVDAGRISKFTVDVESIWNEEIESVQAEIEVLSGGKKVEGFKTEKRDAAAWAHSELVGFIDATKLTQGEYTSRVTLSYGGKKEQAEFPLVLRPGPVVESPAQFGSISNTQLIIIAAGVITILVLITLINVLLLTRRK